MSCARCHSYGAFVCVTYEAWRGIRDFLDVTSLGDVDLDGGGCAGGRVMGGQLRGAFHDRIGRRRSFTPKDYVRTWDAAGVQPQVLGLGEVEGDMRVARGAGAE